MIDIIIIISCVLAGFALGKFIERIISEKGKFYRDLILYISLLKENVTGRQLELESFNQKIAANSSSKLFSEYLQNHELKVRLTKLQKANLIGFFDNLDCASSQALLEHLNYYEKILAEDAQKVLQHDVAKASIFGKLGMLLGAMLGILLV